MEPPYPPHVRLTNVVISGTEESAVQQQAEDAASWARGCDRARAATGHSHRACPRPIDRIRGRWRWHFLLRAQRPAALGVCRQLFLRYDPKPGRAELRFIIDRDPVTLL